MAIQARCPVCEYKMPYRKKKCRCGANLDYLKQQGRVGYSVVFRVDGKQKRRSFGTDLHAAKAYDAKVVSYGHQGRLSDLVASKNVTFNELAEWYLDLPSVRRLKYHRDLKLYLKHFLERYGNQMVHSITLDHIEALQADKIRTHSASYVDKMIQSVRGMLKKAVDAGKVAYASLKPFNSAPKLLKKNANARNRILSTAEFQLLQTHLSGHLKGIVAMGYYTGMRKAEILNLTWDRVDQDRRLIYLRKEDTKDAEDRYVPICDELLTIIRSIPVSEEGWVFTFRAQPVSDIRTGLQLACEKSGIAYGLRTPEGFVFHDLRHTFNTNARKAGVPESVIMKITGHSTREMFDRYNTVDLDDLQVAAKSVGSFLNGD